MDVDECDLDEFVLFYLKHRIEHDGKYLWYDAPYIRSNIGPNIERILNFAIHIEKTRLLPNPKLVEFIQSNDFDFRHYKFVIFF